MILKKASITVEAAIAFPLFFMTVICITSIMNVYGQALDKTIDLRNKAEKAALAAGTLSIETWIKLNEKIEFCPYFLPDGLASVKVSCAARARTWTGRDEETTQVGKNSNTEYVYVTENKSVYHKSADCTHINLSVKQVSESEVASLRNEDGKKYHACDCCSQGLDLGVVYITDHGDCYHFARECSGLKRSVKLVSVDDAGSLKACSRCGSE